MKHPFSMNVDQIDSVKSSLKELDSGEITRVSGALSVQLPDDIISKRPDITTLALGEEGGSKCTNIGFSLGGEYGGPYKPIFTTMALGEEGGCHHYW